jgi:hypothetical protein
MKPAEIIRFFDEFLLKRSKRFEAVCIGGTALALLKVISRETRDCDVLSPVIPDDIKELSKEFAREVSGQGLLLQEGWLNNGPSSLIRDLPPGWEGKTVLIYEGEAIRLYTLGRSDFLRSKLFALCDRAVDGADCLALEPKREELLRILPWLSERDGNPDWPEHVRETLAELAKILGYEL